jgi:hypothetical protein
MKIRDLMEAAKTSPNAEVVTWNGKSLDGVRHEPGPGRYVVRIDGYGVIGVTLMDNGMVSTERADSRALKQSGLSWTLVGHLASKAVKKANPSMFRFTRF